MFIFSFFKSNSNKEIIIIITEINTQMVVRKSYLFNNVGIFMHCRELARNEIETDSFFTFARIIIQQKYIIFVCD